MTTTDTDRLVHRWFEELFNEGDLEVLDELVVDDVEYHGPRSLSPGDADDPEALADYVRVYRSAFPDLRFTVEEVIDAGDAVTVRWTCRGTHDSRLLGIEPTGEVFVGSGINLFRVSDDGRFEAVWSDWDTLAMAQDLDIVPPMEELGR